jgi:hypothetical protein
VEEEETGWVRVGLRINGDNDDDMDDTAAATTTTTTTTTSGGIPQSA